MILRECFSKSRISMKMEKLILYDGRTGETFDNRVTVGYMYILKLASLSWW